FCGYILTASCEKKKRKKAKKYFFHCCILLILLFSFQIARMIFKATTFKPLYDYFILTNFFNLIAIPRCWTSEINVEITILFVKRVFNISIKCSIISGIFIFEFTAFFKWEAVWFSFGHSVFVSSSCHPCSFD